MVAPEEEGRRWLLCDGGDVHGRRSRQLSDHSISAGITMDTSASRGGCRRSAAAGILSRRDAEDAGGHRVLRGSVAVIGTLALLHLISFAMLIGSVDGQASTLEGIYRYGHITWERDGDAVEIRLETAFRRSSNNELFQGTAPDGLAAVGDVLTLYGKEPPQLLYGDETVATVLKMTVTAYSVMEDWVMGEMVFRHTYRTPNDAGRPWLVQYVGCCRLSSLANNADANWAVTAEIDLLAASRSPRAATLPMINVPKMDMNGMLPSIYIPTQQSRGMEWGEGKPFYVGSVLALEGGAYLGVNLTSSAAGPGCMSSRSGSGCLVELLRGDASLPESSLTVEGWIKPNATEGGYALAAVEQGMATLLVHVGGMAITVGHDRSGGARVEAVFPLAHDVTGKWVHVTVRRTVTTTTCADDLSRPNVVYHVWADGMAVWQEGMAVQESAEHCGPHASVGEEMLLKRGQLLFGTDGSMPGMVAQLDEWRLWNGAVSETDIRERMNMLLTPDKENFLGDPTTATHALMALYDMDPPRPCDTPPCEVPHVVPLYPRTGAEPLTAMTMGGGRAVTAEPDSTGVMGWESAVAEVAMTGMHGLVSINPRHGPGQYQVTLSLALSGGRARVLLDLVVTVLDAEYDAGADLWRLCAAGECAHAGNEWVPRLDVSGYVKPMGECNALMAPPSAQVAAMDLRELLFPCTLTVFVGFQMSVMLTGVDNQAGMVGFNFGARPEGMVLNVHETGSTSRMEVAWRPCADDIGLHAVCMDASDRHMNGTVQSASAPMACMKLNVTRDPAPRFDTRPGRTPSDLPPLTIGEEVTVDLFAFDGNCLDSLRIEPALPGEVDDSVPLPPGAMLHEGDSSMLGADGMAMDPEQCVGVRRRLSWMPSYNHGGWEGRVCFVAVDSGGGCEGGVGQRTVHCLHMEVRRCVYALQADQQLQEVAAMFGTDWMRLWSLNPALMHPDFLMYEGTHQTLMVGHLYQAAASDSAGGVARRMGMTMEQLHLLNFDVSADDMLEPGQHLCVIPNSCTGAANTHYSDIQYENSDFFVKYKSDEVPLQQQT